MCVFTQWCLGHHLPEGGKERIFTGWMLGGIKWELRARPKVELVLHQVHNVDATQDQVVIGVIPGIPDRHSLEQTTVRTKDVFRPGPHLLATNEYSPRPAVPCILDI